MGLMKKGDFSTIVLKMSFITRGGINDPVYNATLVSLGKGDDNGKTHTLGKMLKVQIVKLLLLISLWGLEAALSILFD